MADRHVIALEVVVRKRLPIVVVLGIPTPMFGGGNQCLSVISAARAEHIRNAPQDLARLPITLCDRNKLVDVERLEPLGDVTEPLA